MGRRIDTLTALGRLKGRGYKTRLLNPYDAFWDLRLRIQTFGFHPGKGDADDPYWQVHYVPTQYNELFRLLKIAGLSHDDVFIDLGCGMGRATFVASFMGARCSIGVEVVQGLFDVASKNLQQTRLSARPIQFVSADAASYENRDASVLFMCNPFGEATLRRTLQNFVENAAHDRPLRIIYRNPMFESVLHSMPWLKLVGRLPPLRSWPSTMDSDETTFWQSVI